MLVIAIIVATLYYTKIIIYITLYYCRHEGIVLGFFVISVKNTAPSIEWMGPKVTLEGRWG